MFLLNEAYFNFLTHISSFDKVKIFSESLYNTKSQLGQTSLTRGIQFIIKDTILAFDY